MIKDQIKLGMVVTKLNKKDLAKKVGVNEKTVNDWLKGASPQISKINAICRALGTDPNHLLEFEFSDAKVHEIQLNSKVVNDLHILVADIEQTFVKGEVD